jgi:hypothetical protein
MVTYWKSKVELFGPDRAFHTITTRDLIELGGEEALKKGGIRCLPEKDASGRGIVVIDRTRFDQRISSRMHMVRISRLCPLLLSSLVFWTGRSTVVV